jgi:hypothetical protein
MDFFNISGKSLKGKIIKEKFIKNIPIIWYNKNKFYGNEGDI